MIELAAEHGYGAPADHRPDDLRRVVPGRGANRRDLELYLETFNHTFGVMQHADAIERVSAECVEDLAADGVVYAEVRMAPELCLEVGLTLDEAIEAMLRGFRAGQAAATSTSG